MESKIIDLGGGLKEHIYYSSRDILHFHFITLYDIKHGEYRRYNGEDGKLWFHYYHNNGKIEGERLKYYVT